MKVENALLKEGDLGLLVLPLMGNVPQYRVVLFKVMRRFFLDWYYRYDGTIDPLQYTSWMYLGTSGLNSGDEITDISLDRIYTIFHFAIGLAPETVRMYIQFPAGVVQYGWLIRRISTVTPGEPHDYISGRMSPISDPSPLYMFVIFRGMSFRIALYNAGSFPISPRLRVLGAVYGICPISDRSLLDAVLSGEISAKYLTVGGIVDFSYTIPDEWKKYAFTISESDLLNAYKKYLESQ